MCDGSTPRTRGETASSFGPPRAMEISTLPGLADAMLAPSFYPGPPTEVLLVETHVSWVFLAGPRAYKLRKPVVFPFLDYGSLERRLHMSCEEVRLGRRLANRLYLGVRAVVRNAGGDFEFADVDAPDAVDYVVEMHRYDGDRTLSALLDRGEVSEGDIRRVAQRIVAFHAEAEVASDVSLGAQGVGANVDANFTTMLPFAEEIGAHLLAAGHRFSVAFVHRHRDLLERRVREGWVRDCHGDLRAEQVILADDDVEIPDPVEFDPGLRLTDIAADLAFLVMDLYDANAENLADVLLAASVAPGVDYGGQQLLFFYATYRAWVRAKVACMRAGGLPSGAERERQIHDAHRFAVLGRTLAWHARRPIVLVVCGRSAVGKSVIAAELDERSGLQILSSDIVRKQLTGLAPSDRAPDDAYSEYLTIQTYRELGARAAESATAGGVIVDATFRSRLQRDAFTEGFRESLPAPLYVMCSAPESLLLTRARDRERDPARISDAGPDIVARQAGELDPFDEIPADRVLQLRTDRPPSDSADRIEAWLDGLLAP